MVKKCCSIVGKSLVLMLKPSFCPPIGGPFFRAPQTWTEVDPGSSLRAHPATYGADAFGSGGWIAGSLG